MLPHALLGRALRQTTCATALGPSAAARRRRASSSSTRTCAGAGMSEGEFVNMRPHSRPEARRARTSTRAPTPTTRSPGWSRTSPDNSGKVGMWGISYPGFYAAAGMIDAHPALVAVSPQAPIADWFVRRLPPPRRVLPPARVQLLRELRAAAAGADHREAARSLRPRHPRRLRVLPRARPARERRPNATSSGDVPFWTRRSPTRNYDAFWQARNLLPHLHDVAPHVLVVGGLVRRRGSLRTARDLPRDRARETRASTTSS